MMYIEHEGWIKAPDGTVLFTTSDGKQIRDGDEFWTYIEQAENQQETIYMLKARSPFSEFRQQHNTFSTKELAEKKITKK